LNAGALGALIFSSAPVAGLRPVRDARLRTSNVPNPTSATHPLNSGFERDTAVSTQHGYQWRRYEGPQFNYLTYLYILVATNMR